MVRVLARDTNGRGFDSRPFHFQVTTLGKLITHMCLLNCIYTDMHCFSDTRKCTAVLVPRCSCSIECSILFFQANKMID